MNTLLKYFNLFMVLIYVLVGVSLLVFRERFTFLATSQLTVLGIMLILYGLWRAYKLYSIWNKE